MTPPAGGPALSAVPAMVMRMTNYQRLLCFMVPFSIMFACGLLVYGK